MDTVDPPLVRIGKVVAFLFFIGIVIAIGIFFYSFTFVNDMAEKEEPILDFLPKPNLDRNPDSILIWINEVSDLNESYWGDQIDDFIEEYANESYWEGNGKICSFANGQSATNDSHCMVKVDYIEDMENNFGYTLDIDNDNLTQPSVVLILKNMEGWEPEPYTVDDLNEIKDLKMPSQLRDRIRQLDRGSPMDQRRLNTIWFSCEGVNPADKENMGPVHFYSPGKGAQDFPGIPNYYFPYLEQPGYQTPFVIAQFLNLRESLLVGVECTAWAKNIGPDDQGFVKVEFELLIDYD